MVTARAPRVVLLFRSDPAAAAHAGSLHRILEWFGRVWGGAHMICVPSDDGPVAPVFRRLARAYDPDIVLAWQPTLGAAALDDFGSAKAVVDGWRNSATAGRNATLDGLNDDAAIRRSAIRVGTGPSPAATESLLDSVSAFRSPASAAATWHLQADLPSPLTALRALAEPTRLVLGRPLPPATEFAAARERLGLLSGELDTTGLDPWLRTLLKLRLGVVGMPEADEPAGLRPDGETVRRERVDPDADADAAVCVGLAGRPLVSPAPAWAEPGSLATTPLRRTATGLLPLSYGQLLPKPYLLVVGDSAEDCCLYLCWLRTYGEGSAAWLPASAAAGDAAERHVAFATELVRDQIVDDLPGPSYLRGWMTSCSLEPQELHGLWDALAAPHWHRDVPARFAAMPVVAPDQIEMDEPAPVYTAVADVFDQALPILIGDDDTAGAIVRSPVPGLLFRDGAAGAGGLLGNWVADATVARCRLPARSAAAAAAELDASVIEAGLVRVGRTGTAWVAVDRPGAPADVHVDHALTGLSLRDPSMAVLLSELLPDGWSWQPSDAGRFYRGLEEMAGGLDQLVAALRDGPTRAVLEAFLAQGKDSAGLALKDGRRYLRLSDFRKYANGRGAHRGDDRTDVPTMRSVLDRLLRQRVLARGLVLKCSRCRNTAFQPIGSVDGGFTCPRCLFGQPLEGAAWCDTPPHEPAWFYRLDELVYQALAHNIAVPALCLAELGALDGAARFSWSIELLQNGKRTLELDFVCLSRGRLTAGEAKSNGTLGNTREAAREAAKTLRGAGLVQADEAVFATTRPEWDSTALAAISAHATALDPPRTRLMTGLR